MIIKQIHWIVRSEGTISLQQAEEMTRRVHKDHIVAEFRSFDGKPMRMESRTEWISIKGVEKSDVTISSEIDMIN